MIYRNMIHPSLLLSLMLTGLVLTGCGGGSGDSETAPTNNKPITPISTASSSAAQSSEASNKVDQSSTPTSLAAKSSNAHSSLQATSSYARISRASASAASSTDFIDEIIIPTDPIDVMDLPPSAPTNLKLLGSTSKTINIEWSPATDDHGIANYEIRRNGVYIGSSSNQKTSFSDTSLASNSIYIYTVRAVDTIGHRSSFSEILSAKTSAEISSSSSSQSSKANASSLSSKTNSSTRSSTASTSSFSSRMNSSAQSSSNSSSKTSELKLAWRIPTQRESGEFLELREIGGYELRHQALGSSAYTSIIIPNATTTNHTIAYSTLTDNYEIAAFDVNGLYSRFIKLTPR